MQHEQLLLVSKAAMQLVELLEHPLGERSAVEVLPCGGTSRTSSWQRSR